MFVRLLLERAGLAVRLVVAETGRNADRRLSSGVGLSDADAELRVEGVLVRRGRRVRLARHFRQSDGDAQAVSLADYYVRFRRLADTA